MSQHRALELFAGIGGESLALRALGIKTVGYCEIDPFCQTVLKSNMARGRLDDAPIYADVTTMSKKDVQGKVDVIAGGFPCKGLSNMGKRAGLYGDPRSRLVSHVYRLIDELKPKHIFLENTPLIVRDKNYPKLLAEFINRGYDCAFIVASASEVGARHMRRRWFLLASKKNAPPLRLRESGCNKLERHFHQIPRALTEERQHRKAKNLCAAYGNTVVPAQAARAMIVLRNALRAVQPGNSESDNLKLRQTFSKTCRFPTVMLDESGTVYEDRSYVPDTSGCSGEGFNVQPPRGNGGRPILSRLKTNFKSQCMPTPRTSTNCALGGASMTNRTRRDPGNFLLASKEMYPDERVPSESMKKTLAVSDDFWSINMGFPRDWVGESLKRLLKKYE